MTPLTPAMPRQPYILLLARFKISHRLNKHQRMRLIENQLEAALAFIVAITQINFKCKQRHEGIDENASAARRRYVAAHNGA